MQYLLSEEEYTEYLRTLKKKQVYDSIDKEELQRVCTLAAVNTLLPDCWISGYGKVNAWGCILSKESGMESCDDCPSKKVCPNNFKQWSK